MQGARDASTGSPARRRTSQLAPDLMPPPALVSAIHPRSFSTNYQCLATMPSRSTVKPYARQERTRVRALDASHLSSSMGEFCPELINISPATGRRRTWHGRRSRARVVAGGSTMGNLSPRPWRTNDSSITTSRRYSARSAKRPGRAKAVWTPTGGCSSSASARRTHTRAAAARPFTASPSRKTRGNRAERGPRLKIDSRCRRPI
jgi:hypothetical protein